MTRERPRRRLPNASVTFLSSMQGRTLVEGKICDRRVTYVCDSVT
ncbi:hypothetical protein LI90_3333 [Carbonactinospora thermoautotrophica]|uniref:Uncharacterized protein n=1 Tax=Carbonactinospora thermoautotrophica TaxID=1469144 RepID=A0A132MX61_9ACTN|nr:hypothetical protein LI90_3333 [Carbonactinospora thermoautotrophica]